MDSKVLKALFDFNRDGKLDYLERAAAFEFLNEPMYESEDLLDGENEYLVDEIESADLDYDELAFMDEDERYEALEEAGLDPEDYDF